MAHLSVSVSDSEISEVPTQTVRQPDRNDPLSPRIVSAQARAVYCPAAKSKQYGEQLRDVNFGLDTKPSQTLISETMTLIRP